MHADISPVTRLAIYLRDDCRCIYCGHAITKKTASLDHVVPRSLGGATNPSNLITACFCCNKNRGVKDIKPKHIAKVQAQLGLSLEPFRQAALQARITGATIIQ
jgi:5-methylcytosine-specific restriction endonuclease McrA